MTTPRTPTIFLDDGSELPLPTLFEVCRTCGGTGKHVNPAIDGHGLSREDFDEDPDFAEAYKAGVYDVTCARCGGQRVTPTLDVKRCQPQHLEIYRRQQRELAELREDEASELRMGA